MSRTTWRAGNQTNTLFLFCLNHPSVGVEVKTLLCRKKTQNQFGSNIFSFILDFFCLYLITCSTSQTGAQVCIQSHFYQFGWILLNFINENNNKDLLVLNVVYKCRWDIPQRWSYLRCFSCHHITIAPASCFETHPELQLLLLDLVSDLIIIMLSLMPEIFCSWVLLLLPASGSCWDINDYGAIPTNL